MKLPTNNKQKQMTLGVLKALYNSRYKEGNYDKAVEIKKEIEKIENIKL